jgi:hypothetical protein
MKRTAMIWAAACAGAGRVGGNGSGKRHSPTGSDYEGGPDGGGCTLR